MSQKEKTNLILLEHFKFRLAIMPVNITRAVQVEAGLRL